MSILVPNLVLSSTPEALGVTLTEYIDNVRGFGNILAAMTCDCNKYYHYVMIMNS